MGQKQLAKKGINAGLFTLTENIRKKNPKIKKFDKIFDSNKMILINKIRKSNGNPAWNKGRKGPPSPVKGLTMSQVPWMRRSRLKRKKTMLERYPDGFKPTEETRKKLSLSLKGKNTWTKGSTPWNKGLNGIDLTKTLKKIRRKAG